MGRLSCFLSILVRIRKLCFHVSLLWGFESRSSSLDMPSVLRVHRQAAHPKASGAWLLAAVSTALPLSLSKYIDSEPFLLPSAV